MNGERYFNDREDAGNKLAELLEKYREKDAVILALPRGGVVIGKTIAKKLNLPLGLVVVRKIGHPYNPEYGIAAISENGKIVKDELEVENIDPDWFREESDRQLEEAKRRRERYWGDQKPIDLKNKIAILIDDGLATGLTMMAAIAEVKDQNPSKIIVASPVSPSDTASKIEMMVDEFIAVSIPDPFIGAIGSYYEYFPQISDEEVIELLKDPPGKILIEMAFYHDLAEQVHDGLKDLEHSGYRFVRFPNDEFQTNLNQEAMGNNYFYIGTIEPPADLIFEYFITCHTLKKENVNKITAILPYLAYMRQDVDQPLKSLSADFIAKSLEAYGVNEVVTIDVHSSYAKSYFNIPLTSLSPALLFANRLKKEIRDFSDYSIVAPDEGAVNRAEDLRRELKIQKDITYFLKERKADRIVSAMAGAAPESRAIVVDDILDTGNTLIKCAEALKNSGVREIIIVTTHGLFTGELWQELFGLNVKKIITTDSSLRAKGKASQNIEVLSTAPILINYFKSRIK